MQLKMIAPMDIGLEQQDLSLRIGQEDLFDLDTKDGTLRRTLQSELVVNIEDGDIAVSSEDEAEYGLEDRGETMAQSGDENEQRLVELEAELEGMYEAYQDRLRDRDVKYKVRAARDLKMDQWNGIESRDAGFESGEEEIRKGGWDITQQAKLQDSDSDDFPSESEEDPKERTKKRPRLERDSVSRQKRRRLSPGHSNAETTASAAAKLWFSQDVFKGLHPLNDPEDEDDTSESVDPSKDDVSLPGTVYDDEVRFFATRLSQ
jgi:AdoMet-dependent rRNA methyltransferase SPB1